jgi:hypothetical protein
MWIEILAAQVKARGLGPVAREIDYSKATLSLVLSGKYDANPRRIEEAVLRLYGTVACPFEERPLTARECQEWRQRDVPTSSAWALKHWSACQDCPHNPAPKERP